ncbi:hypothetical protein D6833_01315 [Candidatus Parcubacteria bacterium]|nr:MAG: hypothetical protein D6833_01315 [Candidatus Parcubacteria bacterium]
MHEWEIMDRFARTLEDPQDREALVHALRGKGAFRRFRNAIRRLGVEEAWYDYLDQALRQIAVEWCEEEGIPFVDD